MPNALTSTGLTVDSQSELLTYYTTGYQSIYGADIVLTSDTSDGQLINLLIQATLDVEDLILAVFTSFDPNQAIGTALDMRCAINGIQRKQGTYTIQPVTVNTGAGSVNLYGLDQTAQQVYTVSDTAGNQYQLQNTQLGYSGTSSFSFQALNVGAVVSNPNAIQVQVTPVVGVTSVINPSTYTVLGTNEETDAALRVRRAQSVALPAEGYYEALYGALLNIQGVTYATVIENDTGSTVNSVPAHSIWVIVAGTAAAADIAQAIYVERNAGCGFYSSAPNVQSYAVTRPNGSSFTVYWSTVQEVPIYIYFQTYSLNGTTPPNLAAISTTLPTTFLPNVNATVNANEIGTLVNAIDPNTLVLNASFETGVVQIITLSGSTSSGSGSAKLSYGSSSTSAITPSNWTASYLQTHLRTLTTDTSLTVTGTSNTGPFTVTFVTITEPTLLGVNTNSLETSGSAAISITFLANFTNFLVPGTANDQFNTTSSNLVMLPMILVGATSSTSIGYTISGNQVTATTLSIAEATNFTFSALGGYGPYTYTLTTNGSGGSISGAIYTSGSTPGTSEDVVTVTDSLGYTTTCVISVVS